jgi:MutS domain V
MKAFLMFRDRDFDPTQLLIRRERELRSSRKSTDEPLDLQRPLPWNQEALRRDLGLDIQLNAMAQGDRFLFDVAAVAMLSSMRDLDAIRYRQRILADCLDNSLIVADMYRVTMDAIEGEKKNYLGFFSRYPSGVLHRSVEVLQMFVKNLRRLRGIADQHQSRFASEGMCRLFAMLSQELSDDYFAEIERHLNRLKFRQGVLMSARLGPGSKGKDYVLRKPHEDKRSWLGRLLAERPPSYSFTLHPRDEAGMRALGELTDRGVNLVANAVGQSTDHILSFFQMLRTELAFYVGCSNLQRELERIGEKICFPTVAPVGQRDLSFVGLYDASLALSLGGKVVGNDVNANQSDLVMVTGANTGGKSTFLRSIGMAYLMAQAGMFVPAETFSCAVSDGVYTHYKREEDATMNSGKWDEELSRMSGIVASVRPNSILLFNESFASTNEREGSEIAGQIVRALLDRHIRIFFVTHLFHFAHSFFVSDATRVTFLRAERRPDGTRPYKLVTGEPLQTSYGEDLYRAIFPSSEPRGRISDSIEDKAAV